MFYCGLARTPTQKCSEAKVVCNSPGPMFDIIRNSTFNVQWINQIKFVVDDRGSELN
jgi:hypothetical protein